MTLTNLHFSKPTDLFVLVISFKEIFEGNFYLISPVSFVYGMQEYFAKENLRTSRKGSERSVICSPQGLP